MGELIKDLGTIHFNNCEYSIELNKCTRKNGMYDIHIQNDRARLNISEQDFCKMAAAVIFADRKIKKYKGETNESS